MALIIRNNCGQYYRGVAIDEKICLLLFKERDFTVSRQDFRNLKMGLYKISDECLNYSAGRHHTIFMGGDHLTSFGTVLSSLRKYGNDFKLIWIDAHTDIHSFESSSSLNLHGMVVRMLMEHEYMDIPRLKPEQLMYVGIRSSEREEIEYILNNKIQYIPMRDLRKDYDGSLNKLANFVKCNNVHISLDVDVLDPSIMSSTGTKENGGLMLEDGLLDIISVIRRYSKHFATDIMEFNPDLGDKKSSIETIRSVIDFLD